MKNRTKNNGKESARIRERELQKYILHIELLDSGESVSAAHSMMATNIEKKQQWQNAIAHFIVRLMRLNRPNCEHNVISQIQTYRNSNAPHSLSQFEISI